MPLYKPVKSLGSQEPLVISHISPPSDSLQGQGKAFFFFYPQTKQLSLNFYHDLTTIATSVGLYIGEYGTEGSLIATKNITTAASPVRSVFTISYNQWSM